jgi:two-component system phosphate regulon response regulator PhoB
MRVLIIEDDKPVRQLIGANLEQEGITVTLAADAASGLSALRWGSFDVVILDISLPDGSGLDVLAELRRAQSNSYVMVVSAAGSEIDRVRALQFGADDYVVKPFFTREVSARVLAVRRRLKPDEETVIRFDGLRIDLMARQVTLDDRPIPLTAREFDLLAFFAGHPGQVFSRDQLLRAVWHSAADWQQQATVTEHIRRLRSKIDHDDGEPTMLATVRGIGYRFDPPSRSPSASEPPGHDHPAAALPDPAAVPVAASTLVQVEGSIVAADPGILTLVGVGDEAELVGRKFLDLVAANSIDVALSLMEASGAGIDSDSRIIDLRRADGGEFTVEVMSTRTEWRGSQAGRFVVTPVLARSVIPASIVPDITT